MTTLAPSFLYESTSFLWVTRPLMKAWMSSNIGQIPPLTPELSALGRLKNRSIIIILAGKEDNHNSSDEFEFQPDSTKDCGVTCP